jgi:hypothetical protein
MIEINSKNSLCPLSHFTEHLVGVFRKSPLKYNLNYKTSSFLIRQLKNNTGFTLQQFLQSVNELKIEIWCSLMFLRSQMQGVGLGAHASW